MKLRDLFDALDSKTMINLFSIRQGDLINETLVMDIPSSAIVNYLDCRVYHVAIQEPFNRLFIGID